MNVRLSLLALGLAAVASPAFAQNYADIYNLTESGDIVLTSGEVDVTGTVNISSKSAAVADQVQDVEGNVTDGSATHVANLTDGALQGASGNIGVNVSSGTGNAQANDAALSAVDGSRVFASAMVTSNQLNLGNYAKVEEDDANYSATLDGSALAGARGNIGVNVAAGVGNAQGNAMAASVNTTGRYAIAASSSYQGVGFNELDAFDAMLDTYAYFGGNALAGAQGNIGVNVTAGVGNTQHNGLAIASATSP